MTDAAAMPIFDGGVFAGHDLETGLEHPIEAVLDEFDRYGVARGVVGSYRSIYQDLDAGNREAAGWATRYPDRVVPLALLHPAYYGMPADTLLDRLKSELGFGVVGLFSAPAYYPVEWDAPMVAHIGEAAAERGIALQAGIRTAGELGAVARAWGDLPVPVMVRWMAGHRYKTLASEIAVAERCRTFLFDVGNLSSTGALEHAVQAIGAERFFFASNSPHNIATCPHAVLHGARLDPASRAAISGGTVTRSLALARDEGRRAPLSAFETEAWRSLCVRPKVDTHWHPDHWNLGEPSLSEDEQRATFTRFGYERVVVSAIRALNHDLSGGNALTAEWCDKDARVFGLIVVNPLHGELSLQEIDRYADHPRFVGVKTIQDVFGLGLDDPRYEPILAKAAQHGLPVMAHLPGMAQAAKRHPEITFVGAHANWGRARGLIDLPNVCFDFSTGHALRHETRLATFTEAVGPHRVLFGSDGQLVSPQWSLAKLFEAGLKAEHEEAILRANAYRLFPKLRR